MHTNKSLLAAALVLAVALITPGRALAHCQIPCGIYDDPARFTALLENLTTIEKSMNQINELSADDPAAHVNQLVRWVNNKEAHVDDFTEIVTAYFMAQRIKPVAKTDRAAYEKYLTQIELLHRMVVTGMKCRQTTDLENVRVLRELVAAFKKSYLVE